MELKLFLEAKGIQQTLMAVDSDHQRAMKEFMKSESTSWSEPYSYWARRLRQYLRAVDSTFGTASPSTVTKQLVEILNATIYSITGKKCFSLPPRDESEVHIRIEAVLRSVFPDLRHKPAIAKAIKNFEPDTGLPSVRTLIEYKFVDSQADVKRVADEVLADTRGYASTDWDQFVFVIYETRRLKSVVQWKELLSSSGADERTEILVICGEEPPRRRDVTGASTRTNDRKPGKRQST